VGKKDQKRSASVFKTGAISLAFLVLGYQVSLFVHRAAVLRIESVRDNPDTVFVVDEKMACRVLDVSDAASLPQERPAVMRKEARHSEPVVEVLEAVRPVESFRFNPNTVEEEDLKRLGFSAKQAQSILNYRKKGGRFRRKTDFADSYVVSDSVFKRLEPFIDIPLIDINAADSAAFDSLPGIGGWFASRMVSYRDELGGYSYPEQLMDIYRFDGDKYKALSDLICCHGPSEPFRIWSLPAENLKQHPYIGNWQTARSIVLFRENTPREEWSVKALAAAGILDLTAAEKLEKCYLE